MTDLDSILDGDETDERFLEITQEQARIKKGIRAVHGSNQSIVKDVASIAGALQHIKETLEEQDKKLLVMETKQDGIERQLSSGGSVTVDARTNIDGNIEGDMAGGSIEKTKS